MMWFFNKLGRRRSPEATEPKAASPACDVCERPIQWEQGYGLTTTQVTTTEDYWYYLFTHQGSAIHQMDPEGKRLTDLVTRQANQPTPWLVCDSCASLFDVDLQLARQFNRQGTIPPGNGPANEGHTALAAAYAWSRLYRCWPPTVQLGKLPATGGECGFCLRPFFDGEEIALVKEEAVKKFEASCGFEHTGPPPAQLIGGKLMISAWAACSLCAGTSVPTGFSLKRSKVVKS